MLCCFAILGNGEMINVRLASLSQETETQLLPTFRLNLFSQPGRSRKRPTAKKSNPASLSAGKLRNAAAMACPADKF